MGLSTTLVQKLTQVLKPFSPEFRDNLLVIGVEGKTLSFSTLDLELASDELLLAAKAGATLTTNRSYESMVRFESHHLFPPSMLLEEGVKLRDEKNGISYRLGTPSLPFFVHFLESADQRELDRSTPRYRLERALGRDAGAEPRLLGEFLLTLFPIVTAEVSSDGVSSARKLGNLTEAFLFTLSYNLDVAVIEIRRFDQRRRLRPTGPRRARVADLQPPQRIYTSELLYHYQMALGTESLPSQYLSFYHILEHHFEKIFNQDLANQLRIRLTSPAFSHHREKDLVQLIKLVAKSGKSRGQDGPINEERALALTLQRYVTKPDWDEILKGIDQPLRDHCKAGPVSFSGGVAVDLESSNVGDVLDGLAKRIYRTRNAIVHSKDGDKKTYTPFQDDEALLKEVKLIRALSESVIVAESRILE
jgi:hypothetical protein